MFTYKEREETLYSVICDLDLESLVRLIELFRFIVLFKVFEEEEWDNLDKKIQDQILRFPKISELYNYDFSHLTKEENFLLSIEDIELDSLVKLMKYISDYYKVETLKLNDNLKKSCVEFNFDSEAIKGLITLISIPYMATNIEKSSNYIPTMLN